MRYRLRTLLIVLALGPPVLAWGWIELARRSVARPKKTLQMYRMTSQDYLQHRWILVSSPTAEQLAKWRQEAEEAAEAADIAAMQASNK